jgi:hypothetical protein
MSSEPQAGENADDQDLAGIGRDGVLEVTVDAPLKENDGTKDAYVSYLVSTHVSAGNQTQCIHSNLLYSPDRLQILSEIRLLRPSALHRLCVPPASPASRLPGLRYPSRPGKEQHVIRSWGPL